ncbi:MAG: hypothetical protein JOY61_16380 [Chloroflexi bacterium]|nr:hypothetical protein [Chloroflexota bacterium]
MPSVPTNDEADDAAVGANDASQIDVEQIAGMVYQLMLDDLAIGRERGA